MLFPIPLLLPLMVSCVLAQAPVAPMKPAEPDGSRTIGIVPPFRGEPTAPGWLRATSHAVAAVDTQHYLYEAYAGPKGQWLVRYLMLPETDEIFREIEQVFLFTSDPAKKPREIPPADVTFDPKAATWKGQAFTLVDRRDLMKP